MERETGGRAWVGVERADSARQQKKQTVIHGHGRDPCLCPCAGYPIPQFGRSSRADLISCSCFVRVLCWCGRRCTGAGGGHLLRRHSSLARASRHIFVFFQPIPPPLSLLILYIVVVRWGDGVDRYK